MIHARERVQRRMGVAYTCQGHVDISIDLSIHQVFTGLIWRHSFGNGHLSRFFGAY